MSIQKFTKTFFSFKKFQKFGIILLLNFYLIISTQPNIDNLRSLKDYTIILTKNRNLFSSKSIYYKTEFRQNNITGTGDILKDVPYKVICQILNCVSGCCEGDITNVFCSIEANCKNWAYHKIAGTVTAAVVSPICIVLFFTFVFMFFYKRNKFSVLKSFILAFFSLFIITIPYLLYCFKPNKENSDKYIYFSSLNFLIYV